METEVRWGDPFGQKRDGCGIAMVNRESPSIFDASSQGLQRDLLTKAVALANKAVIADSNNDFSGALRSYQEACSLLRQLMGFTISEQDLQRLSGILETYKERVDLLDTIFTETTVHSDTSSLSSAFTKTNPFDGHFQDFSFKNDDGTVEKRQQADGSKLPTCPSSSSLGRSSTQSTGSNHRRVFEISTDKTSPWSYKIDDVSSTKSGYSRDRESDASSRHGLNFDFGTDLDLDVYQWTTRQKLLDPKRNNLSLHVLKSSGMGGRARENKHLANLSIDTNFVRATLPAVTKVNSAGSRHVSAPITQQDLSIGYRTFSNIETRGSYAHPVRPFTNRRSPSSAISPSEEAVSLPSSDLYSNEVVRSTDAGVALFADVKGMEEIPPMEPCPKESMSRVFWFMRSVCKAMTSTNGGNITQNLFLPREIWGVRGVKFRGLEEKMQALDLLTGVLLSIGEWEGDGDLVKAVDRLQNLEAAMDGLQTSLAKKLGNDIRDARPVSGPVSATRPAENQRKFVPQQVNLLGWRRHRKRISLKSIEGIDARLPLGGPFEDYILSLNRFFIAAQTMDRLMFFVDADNASITTRVRMDLSLRRCVDFLSRVVCRWVLIDVGLLLDKYVKGSGQWMSI